MRVPWHWGGVCMVVIGLSVWCGYNQANLQKTVNVGRQSLNTHD